MKQKILKYVYESFVKLVKEYGFSKANEVNEGQSYWIEYLSSTFGVKIEKYRREFDTILYKTGNPDKGINLFNLLRYLNIDFPEFEYFYGEFHEENELEEYYRKQFSYISATIYENFSEINNFFSSGNYESKVADLEKFMLNKYPDLFKKHK